VSAVTQPVGSKKLPKAVGENVVRQWLDALASGTCDQATFLRSMQELLENDLEGNWEVLSLLDQYYRRGKIRAEVFLAIKNKLAGSALGASEAMSSMREPSVPAFVLPEGRTVEMGAAEERAEPDRPLQSGDVLRERYRILGLVGQGGMGTVYDAIDDYRLDEPAMGQRVALKVLHTTVTQRDDLLTELRREFQLLQSLSHPNIVRVHEFDRDGSLAFFTMELLHGTLLQRVLNARQGAALPHDQATAILRDAGAAIVHAHGKGVVHGDINPQNIFITAAGDVKVLDFGTSHRMFEPMASDVVHAPRSFATPSFASCQVLEGGRADPRDDLFALACVAYFLFAGKHPFGGRTAVQARNAGLSAKKPTGLNARQWQALKSGLRWQRDRRPPNVADWLAKLELGGAAYRVAGVNELMEVPPPARGNGGKIAAFAALAILVALGGYWLVQEGGASGDATPATGTVKAHAANAVMRIEEWMQSLKRESGTAAPASITSGDMDPNPTRDAVTAPASAPAALASAPPATGVAAPARAAPVRPQAASAPPPATATAPAGDAPAVLPARPGSARIEMAADAIEVPIEEPVAHITVRRRGSLRGEAAFSWWTESGTAKPGADFVSVASHVEHFEEGKSAMSLNVALAGIPRSQERSFYVVIDQTTEDGAATLGGKTLTMVTLPPSN
jgi:eukaryotic-like serine/threonine-protein kinase